MRPFSCRLWLISVLFLIPNFVFGGVVITEIMYDLEGTDTDREWIEVKNDGTESVELTSLKFFEGGVNHGIVATSDSKILEPGGFAVIADTPSKFKADWPMFSGLLFDSSFSLSNEGESLEIRSAELVSLDSSSYSGSLGAAGNGKTLVKNGSTWVESEPSPGKENITFQSQTPESPSQTPTTGSETQVTTSSGSGSVAPRVTPTIRVKIIGPARAVAGAEIIFQAESSGLEGKPVQNAKYVWSFGDGWRAEGQRVAHDYRQVGSYVIYLDAVSGDYATSDRLNIEITKPDLAIVSFSGGDDGYLEIKNIASDEVDLGAWKLIQQGKEFIFPPHTFIGGGKSTRISNLLLKYSMGREISLAFPSGVVLTTFTPITISQQPSQTAVAVQSATEKKEPALLESKPAPNVKKTAKMIESVPAVQSESSQEGKIEARTDISNEAVALKTGSSSFGSWVWVGALFLLIAISAPFFLKLSNRQLQADPAPDIEIIE